ncbi:MAG: ATP-grasp domain-containing protein [Sandaracinaceae bacterium]|nr:ATP-grasp domain-containing protein [Sandaracinaceae bacterium]
MTGIGERPKEALDDQLRHWLFHYEQVGNVTNAAELERKVRWIQEKVRVDRLEAVVEAHVMAAAKVREACGIPGTSVHTTFLCRDKPAMKEALRQAGVPCAQSTGSKDADEIRLFVEKIGYPVIVKPRDAAGASGTYKCGDARELEHAMAAFGVGKGGSVAVEEFIEGHEGFWDTISIGGRVVHEFVCHYYPNVLEAMRTRWISPQFICTNRVDSAPGYDEIKALGRKVIGALGIRDRRHAHGVVLRPQGPEVQRDRVPPAGRARLGSLRRRQRLRHLPRVGHGGRPRQAQPGALAPLLGRDHRAAPRPRRTHHRLRGGEGDRARLRRVAHRRAPPARGHAHAAGGGRLHGQRVDPHEAPRLRRAPPHARRGGAHREGPRGVIRA